MLTEKKLRLEDTLQLRQDGQRWYHLILVDEDGNEEVLAYVVLFSGGKIHIGQFDDDTITIETIEKVK